MFPEWIALVYKSGNVAGPITSIRELLHCVVPGSFLPQVIDIIPEVADTQYIGRVLLRITGEPHRWD